jgi:molybdopterin-synthase adenylyltransferase
MTAELCLTIADLEFLRSTLLPSDQEHCAILFAEESQRSDGQVRLLVRSVEFPEQSDYQSQSIDNAELSPDFVARVSKRARLQKLTLVFAHTHPGLSPPRFSPIDDRGEQVLDRFLSGRGLNGHHAALVISEGGVRARRLGRNEEIRVVALGAKRIVEFDPDLDEAEYSAIFDRQVRAFGVAGQLRLGRIRVAIVGLGGTGSIAAQ